MSLSLESVSRIAGDLYSAALNPSLLAPALGQIAELAGVSSVNLTDTTAAGHRLISASSGLDVAAVNAYNSYFHAFDRALPICSDPPFAFTRAAIEDVWPGYWKSEFANDWSRPNKIDGICFVTVELPQRQRRTLVLGGRPGETRLGDTTQQLLLTVLKPHLQRMSVLANRMHHLEHHCASVLDVFERMPYGVILLDHHGRVAHATGLAIALIRSDNALHLNSRGLRASDLATDRQLQMAIAAALSIFERPSSQGIGMKSLPVARVISPQPLILHILPLRAGLGPSSLDEDAAMVLICDPARRGYNPANILSQVFNLTPAEAQVAVQVSTGQGLAAVALELGISVNTVRTHLQHVFDKTQTSRQTELGRLVAAFSRVVRPSPSE